MKQIPSASAHTLGGRLLAGVGAVAVGVVVTVASQLIVTQLPQDQPGATHPTPRNGGRLSCPSDHPILGNVSQGGELIAHAPGDEYYDKVRPERCFVDMAAARIEGFRAARR